MLDKELNNRPDLQKHLFEKGYLITDAELDNTDDYPFYGNWNKTTIRGYDFWIYNGVKLFIKTNEEYSLFLIGHCYDPYRMIHDEDEVLSLLEKAYGTASYQKIIDELTGIFITGVISEGKLEFQLDASGMQCGYYGSVNGKIYISSHTQLIGDLCHLKTEDYVSRLVNYRWYHYMLGNYLPGNITSFKEIKRAVCNTVITYSDKEFAVKRIYPVRTINMCQNDADYQAVISEGSRIMKNTMALIPLKWSDPAISLTGGIDSNTTFAAANGNYDKYKTFSYVSMYRESVDAEKAETISKHFGVPYKKYEVPENNDEINDFEIYKKIFAYNGGNIGSNSDSDVRKKITLINNDVCDVEVKSWISETIRAYAYKYFGRKKFPKSLSPRNYTSLYKIFFLNRKLAVETDHYFDEYIEETELKEHLFNYDESDLFVWEMMHGGKCGSDIGVMKSCWDITIPYNNRKLLDTLLRVPLEKRINDDLHMDMKKELNRELYDMNIRVVNLNETEFRKKLINIYYIVNSHLPY
ncbi:MAG: hypothetical protein IJG59_02325 [Erysipelotrichaceae bacterium]|nr:hypothetical protein [Erysipelotrichaceae bacterium]